jgi:uncharacterized heparinase superfamily protein
VSLSRYYHTLRHVPLRQSLLRVCLKLYRPKPDLRPASPRRPISGAPWVQMALRHPIMPSPTRFRLLNEEHEVTTAADWNAPDRKVLWNYNLHYFEDLFAQDAEERRDWHRDLIERWIAENPPGQGVGWEPYPMSLRICNWIKWALSGHELSARGLHSLAVQARYLRRHYDYHLLGNHLLVNAKAFIFTGLFFQGNEADEWYKKGLSILRRQIPEQILSDGGHFERSPMYHNLITEDFLDLLNILRVYGRSADFVWLDELDRMRRWALAMRHPDGQIVLFNDAAFAIAPSAADLEEYAARLGLKSVAFDPREDAPLLPSGYVRACRGSAILFADVAPLGPDYLPGHGHADSLSFELSLRGKRLIVDSGTSLYEICPERLRQRGTAAHNTLQVDGQDSSEVWASFRVARRAKIRDLKITPPLGEMVDKPNSSAILEISAAHDGYRRLRDVGLHRRTWRLSERELTVQDRIEGTGRHEIQIRLHFHPDWQIIAKGNNAFEVHQREQADAKFPGANVTFSSNLAFQAVPSTYHPEFGISLPNQAIVGSFRGELPWEIFTHIVWP